MSFCLIDGDTVARGEAWLSVHVDSSAASASPIAAVALTIYQPWGDIQVAPFEVWLGDKWGDAQVRCTLTDADAEPSHGGVPSVASCPEGAAHEPAHEYVTIRQAGEPRRWQIHEVELFARAPSSLATADPPVARVGQVAHEIAMRYEHGQPSDDLARVRGVAPSSPSPLPCHVLAPHASA